MNITGIIAEYNPFHSGHAYHLSCARRETDADYVIAVMSGNFVQRGAPALLDKYTRARMALSEGADLVLELPPAWSCASAEYFAGAAVCLLGQLGCVQTLCYGCETPDSSLYAKICTILLEEPPLYRRLLHQASRQGASYAAAREKALLALLPATEQADAAAILKNPNNILALEYRKAIAASPFPLKTHPVLRKDCGYHSDSLSGTFASASAIRTLLYSHSRHACQTAENSCTKQTSGLAQQDFQTLARIMPDAALQLLCGYHRQYPFLYEADCSQMLHYCLIKQASEGFGAFADCPQSLSNKICRSLPDYCGFDAFCQSLKSKDLAYARIRRILMHILLDIRKDDYERWRSRLYVPYARILGFRKESAALLGHIKKHSSIPLLARAADAGKILSGRESQAFFQKHLFADAVYRALAAEKGGQAMKDEYRQQTAVIR